jgi:protein-S-isoprenylcysteine O-methyltransferase Ste14
MAGPDRDRVNPWVLVGIAVALIAAVFFFYTGHPVRDSNLYAPSAPGWIAVVIFVLIGILGRIIHIRDHKREAEKHKRDTPPET